MDSATLSAAHSATHAIACNVVRTPLVEDAQPRPPPIARTSQHGVVRVVEQGSWPERTSTLCWHCCHPFDGPPLPMPIRYDDRRDVFHVTGTFCSWECMKAYNGDSRSYMQHVNSTIITLFRKRCTGVLGSVRHAPPRLALKAFGGTMTIEEFRACTKEVMIMPPKLIVHRPVVEEIPARMRTKPTAKQLQESVSFKDATAQNDMLRLRRPKPLTSHNLLVRTMGVQILKPPAAP